jgi:hypothetical protein
VPEYLRLGSVVVIGPTLDRLTRWQEERPLGPPVPSEPGEDLHVDLLGRRVLWRGAAVPLTELEFRVAAGLAGEPGRAWSYRELRRAGWGDGPDLPLDVFAVRSVIQRIRRKLWILGSRVRIEAIRGYGFRLEPAIADSENPGPSEGRRRARDGNDA